MDKHPQHVPELPAEHMLNRYAQAATDNIRATLDRVDPADFDALCKRIADPSRRLQIAGGRLSGTIAQTLYLHLQMIRPNVFLIPQQASWPHYVLDMGPDDTLILFDVRRYENATLLLAEMAMTKGPKSSCSRISGALRCSASPSTHLPRALRCRPPGIRCLACCCWSKALSLRRKRRNGKPLRRGPMSWNKPLTALDCSASSHEPG